MTNDEAIAELKEDIDLYIPTNRTIEDIDRELPDGRLITALEMAIKALETVERIEARRRELEIKLHSSFSLSEATEHYALVKLLREAETEGNE